jgi:hypothetical protein
LRGSMGIPDTKPLLQCFAKQNDRWSFVGAVGSDYRGETFFVYPLRSPIEGQVWFLLTGKAIGGTWSLVNLEVATCDGKQMKVKWRKGGFAGATVDVDSGTVVVTYNKHAEGTGEVIEDSDGDAKVFVDIYHVTPKGLE